MYALIKSNNEAYPHAVVSNHTILAIFKDYQYAKLFFTALSMMEPTDA